MVSLGEGGGPAPKAYEIGAGSIQTSKGLNEYLPRLARHGDGICAGYPLVPFER